MLYQKINPVNKTIREARAEFLQQGITQVPVRTEILDSWRRCREMAVDHSDGICRTILPAERLHRLLSEYNSLIDTAFPIMKTIFKSIHGNDVVVVLTNQKGIILKCIGEAHVMELAQHIGFVQGADWSEKSVGTNAIGTALAIDEPIYVVGEEHYCARHHTWICSAAPIHDYTGELIGCLDVSCFVERESSKDLGMVIAGVRAIENHFFKDGTREKLEEAHKHLTTVLGSISEGILSVDKDGVIKHVNPSLTRILETQASDLVGRKISDALKIAGNRGEVFFINKRCLDEELIIEQADRQIHCIISSTPIQDQAGNSTGTVITFRSIKQVHSSANKMFGSRAVFTFSDIVANSAEMRHVISQAKIAASSSSTVLLQGESGTGKEMLAQAIHNASQQSEGPFVAVNCAAIPRELIQSELFGYTSGSFSGARKEGRSGKFELADGGTLMLDEIGDMPHDLQVALLRVLQEKKVTRIGGNKDISVDVRVIAATNKNLGEEVEKGTFRKDLFYRLHVLSISVPPLRERISDIRLLADFFVSKKSITQGRIIEAVDSEVYNIFEDYPWPGNIRELENILEYAVLMAQQHQLSVDSLPAYFLKEVRSHAKVDQSEPETLCLSELEKQAIVRAIHKHRGNMTQVAQALGIARNTLYEKMKRYGIHK